MGLKVVSLRTSFVELRQPLSAFQRQRQGSSVTKAGSMWDWSTPVPDQPNCLRDVFGAFHMGTSPAMVAVSIGLTAAGAAVLLTTYSTRAPPHPCR